ncbi:hypothetical protein BCR33DRAFT_788797 [Rhizoclosmatium globosum]|uniref:beta-glucosidase n=1 Tax=Rhizoclosmatium globosum TaxID=329046 RepID=A0A1Y2BUX2_9FUNG|nr:hypothetical protein BCR33DRAFT_788797 [Rhizoclosmatium globosum]|eukprot:ORY38561.1 hypothetical protein BCR33DRAFT_788797 [Rhizoclosmatium globosum]
MFVKLNTLLVVLFPLFAFADVCSLAKKVNTYRTSNSLAPLVLDVRLVQIAQTHSEDMSSKKIVNSDQLERMEEDENPDTSKQDAWYASIEKAIPNWTFLAENVAMGSHDENAILDLFKLTEEYNANLLSEEATLLGIGEKDGYWTFEFAGTSDEQVKRKKTGSVPAKPQGSTSFRSRIPSILIIASFVSYLSVRNRDDIKWSPSNPIAPDHPWYNATIHAQEAVKKLSFEEKMDMIMGIGLGSGECVGNIGPIPSIGFKGLCLQDAPTGVRWVENVTAFPSGLNLAATFDKDLMLEYGTVMGNEFRELGINIHLGPAVNLLRAPAAGRNWEGPGGDPYLAAVFSRLLVRGIQSNGVIATVKHLIGNEQEHFRDRSSSNIDKKTSWRNTHFYQACIEEGVGAIMCSYNKLNQQYTCANSELVNEIIKGPELDFRGIIMTDWGAQYDLLVSDLIMPGAYRSWLPWWWWTPYLSHLPFVGYFFPSYHPIPLERLDDMVTRILSTHYALGQDNGFPDVGFHAFNESLGKGAHNTDYRFKEHAKVARKVAAASTVLVKNDGTLPLKNEKGVKIAILGEDARAPKILNEYQDRNGNDGTLAQGWGSGTVQFPYLVSPFEGISMRGNNLDIVSAFDNQDLETAKALASGSDVAIVFGNADSGEMILWHAVEGNWGDRNDLKLWHNADSLIEAVASVNKKTIVVLHTVGPVDMPWFNHPNISAVIYALLPGQESGHALADVLFGDVNPSGRLPFTVLKDRSEYSADVLYRSLQYTPQIDYSEGLYIDYRHADKMNITPVIPFGHGLSYTAFKYSNVEASTTISSEYSDITITMNVENTGGFGGHEVVQLYVSYPETAKEPFKVLKAFEKIWVDVNERVEVKFTLTSKDLRVWLDDGWTNVAGNALVLITAIVLGTLQHGGLKPGPEWTPSKPLSPDHPWFPATQRAIEAVKTLSRDQKLELIMGIGFTGGPCLGNTVTIESIGFKGLCLQDSPMGVQLTDNVTAFPSGLNVAATFDKELMEQYGKAMGKEFNWSRTQSASRSSWWKKLGRPGGDPYLASVSASLIVRGIQSNGVIATAKHLIANEQEHFRHSSSSNLDKRTLMEVYMAPFDACIREGVGAIMCSYNKLNQEYTCANSYLVNEIVKGDLDFRGIVMTDWYAIYDLNVSDLIMPGFHLLALSSPISDERLDDAATRILSTYYHFGQDNDFPPVTINSLERRRKAIHVVVKNDGVLPLKNEMGLKLSILDGTLAQGWGSGTARFPYLTSPEEGISQRGDKLQISTSFDNKDLETAKQLAAESDIAIVFGSSNSGELIVAVMNQIEAVASTNKRTVVVLHTVGPVDMPWFNHPNISAVVYALLPGQESGSALADVLFGDINPSGRLPFTVLKDRSEYAADVLYTSFVHTPQIDYSEGLFIDYRHADKMNITPVIPFGHGLSYTEFEYSGIQTSTTSQSKYSDILVSLRVKNTGSRSGHEVIQLYIGFPEEANEPPKILKGFEKVWIEAGESTIVEFTITKRDLRVWLNDGWFNVAGTYSFHIGASSRDIRLESRIGWGL